MTQCPSFRGGGAGSHPTPDHVIWKWTVYPDTGYGSSGRPGALLKIPIPFSHDCNTPNPHRALLLFWLGKTTIVRIHSRRYRCISLVEVVCRCSINIGKQCIQGSIFRFRKPPSTEKIFAEFPSHSKPIFTPYAHPFRLYCCPFCNINFNFHNILSFSSLFWRTFFLFSFPFHVFPHKIYKPIINK